MEATLRVALPASLLAKPGSWATALDVSALLDEWALGLLDPVEAVRKGAASALAQDGWDLGGKATVTGTTMRLIRQVADDADVIAAVKASACGQLVRGDKLGPQGVCLLLGLAVVVTLQANVGKAAAVFVAEYDKRAVAAARAERAAAERGDGGEARAVPADAKRAAPRPVLSPLPPELSGPHHRRPHRTKASDPL